MSDQKRPYRMRRRAELEEQTRRLITESAVALHEELGPAALRSVPFAKRDGVRRWTVYRHLPDERALLLACSGHYPSPPSPGQREGGATDRPGSGVHSPLTPRSLASRLEWGLVSGFREIRFPQPSPYSKSVERLIVLIVPPSNAARPGITAPQRSRRLVQRALPNGNL